jgi:hypothetical protein
MRVKGTTDMNAAILLAIYILPVLAAHAAFELRRGGAR